MHMHEQLPHLKWRGFACPVLECSWMKISFVYNTTAVAIAIGVIFVSTVTLSVFSYRYTVYRDNPLESQVLQNNSMDAQQVIERIETKIVDNDQILSEMVDVDARDKWPAEVDAIKKAPDLNVDQVYFLRPDTRPSNILFPPYSADIANYWRAFTSSFNMKEIDPERLGLNQVHHLHKERPNNYFFASYVLKETKEGKRILVCFQMNHDKIVALLDKYLRGLQTGYYVSIVDFENNGIYSAPIARTSKYYTEARFNSTLYKWFLQLVPRKYGEIERQLKNQRLFSFFFIIINMTLVLFSLVIIYVGSRRERQLRQLKEDFIGNVSHELKTPLSLIRMFSEILVTGRAKNEEAKQEYYGIIHNQSDRMGRLIGNLLDFASLERAGNQKHFENINIGKLLTKELDAYRPEIQKQGFQLTVEADDHIPDTFADPNAITMAFFNLLDNSVKYSEDQKQIAVRISQTDGFIDLSVSDKGVGIATADQQKIFEKFFRGGNAVSKGIRGSGIGLSITKHVAEMHGGDVLVESEPGKGSTFTLRIPIRQAPGLAGE
jgi:two-component system, OmpR family, phosphate regulon sensor histidine kinase PhoR